MSSIIEDLYYGNIPLSERDFKRNSEYAHILQLAARNEEKLTETLTEAQRETFGKFKDNTSELTSMTEVTAFCLAGGTIYVIENAVSPAAKETGYEKLKRMVLNAPEFNEKRPKSNNI